MISSECLFVLWEFLFLFFAASLSLFVSVTYILLSLSASLLENQHSDIFTRRKTKMSNERHIIILIIKMYVAHCAAYFICKLSVMFKLLYCSFFANSFRFLSISNSFGSYQVLMIQEFKCDLFMCLCMCKYKCLCMLTMNLSSSWTGDDMENFLHEIFWSEEYTDCTMHLNRLRERENAFPIWFSLIVAAVKRFFTMIAHTIRLFTTASAKAKQIHFARVHTHRNSSHILSLFRC